MHRCMMLKKLCFFKVPFSSASAPTDANLLSRARLVDSLGDLQCLLQPLFSPWLLSSPFLLWFCGLYSISSLRHVTRPESQMLNRVIAS